MSPRTAKQPDVKKKHAAEAHTDLNATSLKGHYRQLRSGMHAGRECVCVCVGCKSFILVWWCSWMETHVGTSLSIMSVRRRDLQVINAGCLTVNPPPPKISDYTAQAHRGPHPVCWSHWRRGNIPPVSQDGLADVRVSLASLSVTQHTHTHTYSTCSSSRGSSLH